MPDNLTKYADAVTVVQNIFELKESIFDKDLRELEARLNQKIDDVETRLNQKIGKVETDINNKIDKLEQNLFRFITIGLGITAIIVRLLFLI